jgi:hypothetical protein
MRSRASEETAEPAPRDDRDKFGRFDPSVGNRAQATEQHPMGDGDLIPTPMPINSKKPRTVSLIGRIRLSGAIAVSINRDGRQWFHCESQAKAI